MALTINFSHLIFSVLQVTVLLVINEVTCDSTNNFLHIVSKPAYTEFRESKQTLSVAELPGLVSSLLGLTLTQPLGWDGLLAGNNPFQHPQGVLLITLEGFTSKIPAFDRHDKYMAYPLGKGVYDLHMEPVYRELTNLYEGSEKRPLIADVNTFTKWLEVESVYPFLSSTHSAGLLSEQITSLSDRYQFLDEGVGEDRSVLEQLALLHLISDRLLSEKANIRDDMSDVYHFDISSLRDYFLRYEDDTARINKVLGAVEDTIELVDKTMRTLYSGDHVLMVATIEKQGRTLYRSKRQAGGETGDNVDVSKLNLATDYTENYAIMFNIFLWTSLFLVVALYAISAAMWDMDPGRESIIYRMTSSRIKKE